MLAVEKESAAEKVTLKPLNMHFLMRAMYIVTLNNKQIQNIPVTVVYNVFP